MRIGIIGCGVAGQAAAIALARAGHSIAVFERFAAARPLGAGLLLQPSGLQVLDRLGLRAAAEAFGAPVHELDGRIANGRRVLDLCYAAKEHGLGIHRGALFRILHEALLQSGAELHLDFDVARIEDPAHPVIVSHSGRREGPFDLLIDCAGAHDRLRTGLGPRVHAPVYPWGALWTACPDRSGAFAGKLRQRFDGAHTMVGILPIGRLDDDERRVAFFWSLKLEEFDRQRDAGLDALKTRVLAVWPEAEPIVCEIARFEDLSLASYRDVALKSWRKGRVLVIGDAAHGTSPQLGQGANLALIDALMLAHFLKEPGDIDRALADFERARRPHTNFYRLVSWAVTPMFQSDGRMFPWLRDNVLAHANRMPGGRTMTRTTLSGVRKFPFGLWSAPS